jgi:hypothetical protein
MASQEFGPKDKATGSYRIPSCLRSYVPHLFSYGLVAENLFLRRRTCLIPDYLRWGCAARKGSILYLYVFDWPKSGVLRVPLKNKVTASYLLADPKRAIPVTVEGERVADRRRTGRSPGSVIRQVRSGVIRVWPRIWL